MDKYDLLKNSFFNNNNMNRSFIDEIEEFSGQKFYETDIITLTSYYQSSNLKLSSILVYRSTMINFYNYLVEQGFTKYNNKVPFLQLTEADFYTNNTIHYKKYILNSAMLREYLLIATQQTDIELPARILLQYLGFTRKELLTLQYIEDDTIEYQRKSRITKDTVYIVKKNYTARGKFIEISIKYNNNCFDSTDIISYILTKYIQFRNEVLNRERVYIKKIKRYNVFFEGIFLPSTTDIIINKDIDGIDIPFENKVFGLHIRQNTFDNLNYLRNLYCIDFIVPLDKQKQCKEEMKLCKSKEEAQRTREKYASNVFYKSKDDEEVKIWSLTRNLFKQENIYSTMSWSLIQDTIPEYIGFRKYLEQNNIYFQYKFPNQTIRFFN